MDSGYPKLSSTSEGSSIFTLKFKVASQILYDPTIFDSNNPMSSSFNVSNSKPKWSHYNIRGINSMTSVSVNIPIIEFEDFGKTLNTFCITQ